MPVSFKDIVEASQFVSADPWGAHQAFLCRQSGAIYLRGDAVDGLEELPEDIDDGEKYLEIPGQRELDLGKRLVMDFTIRFLPDDFDEVRRIFSKKGAYGRFKDLLHRRDVREQWYDFEAKAEEQALRKWCELNSIELVD